MVDHDETRSSSHFPNSVGASCFAGENLSTSTQSHDYASNKVETVGQLESNMAIQDSTKEHISQVFLPESNNDFESEVETDYDYNPWENSGN